MSQASGAHRKESVSVKTFSRPELTREFAKGKMDIVTLDGVTFGRATFEPGWKWSECVKPVVKTESCQVAHLCLQLSGKLHIAMDNGTHRDVGPGEVYTIAPGHDAWVVGDEPVVLIDIAGAADYARAK